LGRKRAKEDGTAIATSSEQTKPKDIFQTPDMPLKRSIEDTGDVPPASRRRLSLETVSNDLSNAIHVGLDKLVLDTVDVFSPVFLLNTIAWNSEGKLDPKYKDPTNAQALLKEHPELIDKLKTAWEVKSFKDIRNLSKFYLSRTTAYKLPWISS
jgi:hypothetical protein